MTVMCTETCGNTQNSAFSLLLETVFPFSTQVLEQQHEPRRAIAHAGLAVSTILSRFGFSNIALCYLDRFVLPLPNTDQTEESQEPH